MQILDNCELKCLECIQCLLYNIQEGRNRQPMKELNANIFQEYVI